MPSPASLRLSYALLLAVPLCARAEPGFDSAAVAADDLVRSARELKRRTEVVAVPARPGACSELRMDELRRLMPGVARAVRGLVADIERYAASLDERSRAQRQRKEIVLRARRVALCMESKLSRLEFVCNAEPLVSDAAEGYVDFLGNFGVNRRIYLNPIFWQRADDFAATGVLIHELSHLCGTRDMPRGRYFANSVVFDPSLGAFGGMLVSEPGRERDDERFRRLVLEEFSRGGAYDFYESNADHYRVWAMYGFCLPGVDCIPAPDSGSG